MPRTDTASRLIAAAHERVYAALLDPEALAAWVPPGDMTGSIERFDARPGGSYRMVLTYPEILWDAARGTAIQHKRICRTFSDCTTAPRKGLPSGCYPLDKYYKMSELGKRLKTAKARQ